MPILTRAAAFTLLAVLLEVLIAVALPGGESNPAAGVVMIAGLALPAAFWAARDARDPQRTWRVRPAWCAVTAIVVLLTKAIAVLRSRADVAGAFVGILVAGLVGICLPATLAATRRDAR